MVYLLNCKISSQFHLVQFVGYLARWAVIQKQNCAIMMKL